MTIFGRIAAVIWGVLLSLCLVSTHVMATEAPIQLREGETYYPPSDGR